MSASAAQNAAGRALIDLAGRVAAAANLDADARQNVDFSIEVGDPELAISDALLDTKTPLPADLLKSIRAVVDDLYDESDRGDVIAALDRQAQH